MKRKEIMNYTKDPQGNIESWHDDRQLALLISDIGKNEPQLLALLLGENTPTSEITCNLEYKHEDGRLADMVIRTKNIEALVEIKAERAEFFKHRWSLGSFCNSEDVRRKNYKNNEQLKDYIAWMQMSEDGEIERRLIWLDKYPSASLKKTLAGLSQSDRSKIRELTCSDFVETLRTAVTNDNVSSHSVNLLCQYFVDKGLTMFEFDDEDVHVFTSFLLPSFSQTSEEYDRVTGKGIGRGSKTLTSLEKNWELTSESFLQACGIFLIPVISKYPYTKPLTNVEYKGSYPRREEARPTKLAGTRTIFSDLIIADISGSKLHFEYGIEYSISKEKKETSQDNSVQVKLYCAFRFKHQAVGFREVTLAGGLQDKCFKTCQKLALEIAKLANDTIDAVLVQPDPYRLHSDINNLKKKIDEGIVFVNLS